jgi:hypothetical protein
VVWDWKSVWFLACDCGSLIGTCGRDFGFDLTVAHGLCVRLCDRF